MESSGEESEQHSHPGIPLRGRRPDVKELIAHQHYGPALLIGWATFEAAARTLIPEQFRRPQTPGRVVQVLAQTGFLKPSEADRLRRLADLRNSLIHGELRATVSKDEAGEFVKVLEMLRSQMG